MNVAEMAVLADDAADQESQTLTCALWAREADTLAVCRSFF